MPPIPLSGGLYLIDFMVRNQQSFEKLYHCKNVSQVVVETGTRERGMLSLPLRWECSTIERDVYA